MRLSTLVKLSGAGILAVVVALSSHSGVQAGIAQATLAVSAPASLSDATMVASAPATQPAAAATQPAAAATKPAAAATTANAAATAATYAPCTVDRTPAATTAASMVATMSGTVSAPATVAVNDNPGYLGVKARNIDTCGAQIDEVVGTPAKLAKLQAGDVVVAVDGQALNGLDMLRQYVEAHKPGDKIVLTIQRNGAQLDVTVTLGQRATTAPATMAPTQPVSAAATQPAMQPSAPATLSQ
jgi:C-terminal processing protease CtpA/Prc